MNLDPNIPLTSAEGQERRDPFMKGNQRYLDLRNASMNFWAGHTGRECAPAPSYRDVKGKRVLGRYMDVYGAEACMTWAREHYGNFLKQVLIILGVTGVVFEVDAVFLFFTLPLMGLCLWLKRGYYAKHFNLYYEAQQEIVRTGKPVWVPFDKVRLGFMKWNPNSVWP